MPTPTTFVERWLSSLAPFAFLHPFLKTKQREMVEGVKTIIDMLDG